MKCSPLNCLGQLLVPSSFSIPKQRGQPKPRIGRPHKRLADQESVDAVLPHQGNVCLLVDAALGDQYSVLGDSFQKIQGGPQVKGEIAQVPVIDSDKPVFHPQGPLQFHAIVHLYEDIHAKLVRQIVQFTHLVIFQAGGDK